MGSREWYRTTRCHSPLTTHHSPTGLLLCCLADSLQSLFWGETAFHPYYNDLSSVKTGRVCPPAGIRPKLRLFNGFQSLSWFPETPEGRDGRYGPGRHGHVCPVVRHGPW